MTFTKRVSGVIMLSSGTYEDIELDPTALRQAAMVVALSACAIALGTHGIESIATLATAVGMALLGWVLWSWIAFAVGTTLLRTSETAADWGQILRVTGFATAPGLLAAAGILRPFAGVAVFLAVVWLLAAFTIAVKHALDYTSTTRAVLVCAAAWSVHVVFLLLLLSTPGA